eukprot:2074734-Lingulodinium_polyedra.AAC.1
MAKPQAEEPHGVLHAVVNSCTWFASKLTGASASLQGQWRLAYHGGFAIASAEGQTAVWLRNALDMQ